MPFSWQNPHFIDSLTTVSETPCKMKPNYPYRDTQYRSSDFSTGTFSIDCFYFSDVDISPDDFFEKLSSGVILCQLARYISDQEIQWKGASKATPFKVSKCKCFTKTSFAILEFAILRYLQSCIWKLQKKCFSRFYKLSFSEKVIFQFFLTIS